MEDIDDLKRRLGNIVIGYNKNDEPVTCKDLNAEGSLTVVSERGHLKKNSFLGTLDFLHNII